MPMRTRTILSFSASLLSVPLVALSNVPPDTTDARKIMNAVYDRDRGDKMTSRMKMLISDNAARTRTRVMLNKEIDVPEGTKRLTIFEQPADVRGTGLLSIDYKENERANDQWYFLPSLRKTTRISSGQKSGSFMGSDLNYSDLITADPEDYDFKMLKQSVKVAGDTCWLIEARPRNDRTREETGYVKLHHWVSKESKMIVQSKMWIKEGKKLKYIKFDDIEPIDGILTAKKVYVRTVQNEKTLSQTTLELFDIHYNQDSVQESDFTQRNLERGL